MHFKHNLFFCGNNSVNNGGSDGHIARGLEYPRSCIWTSTFQTAMPGELKSTWNFEVEGTSA